MEPGGLQFIGHNESDVTEVTEYTCLKAGGGISPALFLFFRFALVIWGILKFHINFRIFYFLFMVYGYLNNL